MIKLNDQQIAFFEQFGFIALPGLLADRIDEIEQAFHAVWASHGGGHAGKTHEGKARSCIVPFIDQDERLCSLLDDPRIEGAAASLLGDDFNYVGSDGNFYVGDTPWHSDGQWDSNIRFIKIALYLDALIADTGALRVIPGSHLTGDAFGDGLQNGIFRSEANWGVTGREIPALALETQPGDVVIFNHKTKHSAWGGSTERRMFTLNLSQRFPEDQLDQLRGYIGAHARFWIDRLYSETMIATATPGRMKHLEQVMANDGHLAELAAKAREEMAEPSRG